MREILFRGKRIDTGEWIEGYVYRVTETQNPPFLMVKDFHAISYEVYQDSVSQFTGLKDKNGKRIFEGDVVRCEEGRVCEVVYFTSPGIASFDMKTIAGFDKPYPKLWNLFSGSEVIGNIHDNPELLKEGTK